MTLKNKYTLFIIVRHITLPYKYYLTYEKQNQKNKTENIWHLFDTIKNHQQRIIKMFQQKSKFLVTYSKQDKKANLKNTMTTQYCHVQWL